MLLPVGANVCTVRRARRVRHDGYAACERGQRVCFAPPPTPEVRDGVDNDCNGVVDDVAPVAAAVIHGRALVLAAAVRAEAKSGRRIWRTWRARSRKRVMLLRPTDRRGVDGPQGARGSSGSSERYALAVVPGYLMGSAVSGDRGREAAALRGAGRRARPVEADRWQRRRPRRGSSPGCGARRGTATSRPCASRAALPAALRGGGQPGGAHRADQPTGQGRRPRRPTGSRCTPSIRIRSPAPRWSRAGKSGALSFPVITRRPLGKGAVYALGHDLSTFAAPRCYLELLRAGGRSAPPVLARRVEAKAPAGHVAVTLATAPEGATLRAAPAPRSPTRTTASATRKSDGKEPMRRSVAARPDGERCTTRARRSPCHHLGRRVRFRRRCCARFGMCRGSRLTGCTHALKLRLAAARNLQRDVPQTYGKPGPAAPTRVRRGRRGGQAELATQTGRTGRGSGPRPISRSNPAALSPAGRARASLFDAGFAVGGSSVQSSVRHERPRRAPGALPARSRCIEFPVAGEDALEVATGSRGGIAPAGARSEQRRGASPPCGTTWRCAMRTTRARQHLALARTHPRRRGTPHVPAKIAGAGGDCSRTWPAHATGRSTRLALETMGDFWLARRLRSSLDTTFDDVARLHR